MAAAGDALIDADRLGYDYQACASADIVVSDRRLPRALHAALVEAGCRGAAHTGGVAIALGEPRRSSPLASALAITRGRETTPWLIRRSNREFASRRIDEVEAATARESEDRLGDHAAGIVDLLERCLEIVDPDDGQGCRKRSAGSPCKPRSVDAVGRRRISRSVIGERPAERLRIESAGQLVRGRLGSST